MTPLKSTDTAGLNAAMAIEFAGWRWCDPKLGAFLVDPADGLIRNPPDYCHSTDAIPPYLSKAHSWRCETTQDGFTVRIRLTPEQPNVYATASTLALALVVGMLRAVGVEVEA